MPKFAAYTNPSEASPVCGWYDTDVVKYPALPSLLLELTDEEWDSRMTGRFAVQDGKLIRLD